MEFAVVVEGNGDTNDKSIWEVQIRVRVADVTEMLLSLTTVKNVMVSMNEDSCDRSHMIHQKYRTCARLYFEGQVPE
jgi:hypothetical protein